MANSINLLPEELSYKKGPVKKTTLTIRRLTYTVATLNLILIFVAGGLLLFFSRNMSEKEAKRTELVAKVTELQGLESGLLLSRERLSHIQTVLSQRSNDVLLSKHAMLFSNLPEDTTFSGLKVGNSGSEFFVESKEISGILSLMEKLRGIASLYPSVKIKNLTFSAFTGHEVELLVF